MQIKDVVYKNLERFKRNQIEINDDTKLKEELGIDSFLAISILMELQKEGIGFKDGKIPPLETVSDLINSLEKKNG